eukprot:m.345682 g.345682  ORF g.345682 m.345682 type:complete len:151 (+) comp16560_c3_seq1:290-742(+)
MLGSATLKLAAVRRVAIASSTLARAQCAVRSGPSAVEFGSRVVCRTKHSGLHPRAYPYTLILSDGSTVQAWSSCPETPKVLRLQEDVRNQVPFVLETGNFIDLTGNVARFEAKFADKSFASVARGSDDEADDGKGGARPPWEADDDDDEW